MGNEFTPNNNSKLNYSSPSGSTPQYEAAYHARLLVNADACSIYEAYTTSANKVPVFHFAGCDGTDFHHYNPGWTITCPPNRKPWLGLTSYVAFHGVTLRVPDIRGSKTIHVKVNGKDIDIEVDKRSCELEAPGSFLCVPIIRNGLVAGIIRVLRRAGRPNFTREDQKQLEKIVPFLSLLTSQEHHRVKLIRSLLGIAQHSTESDVLEEIAHEAVSMVGGEEQASAVFLEDPSRRKNDNDERIYVFKAPLAAAGNLEQREYSSHGTGLTVEVLKTGKPLLSANLELDCQVGGALHNLGHVTKNAELKKGKARSFVAVPILSPVEKDKVLGVIRVSSTVTYSFCQRDVATLTTIAEQTTRILRSLWGRDVLFQTLVDTYSSPIIATDNDGKITVFNEAVQRIFGLSWEEAKSKSIVDAVYGGKKALAHKTMDALRKGDGKISDYFAVCYRTDTKAGDLVSIPVRVSASYLRSETGNRIGTIGILEDLRNKDALDQIEKIGPDKPVKGSLDEKRSGITVDRRMKEVFERIRSLGPEDREDPFMLLGESGTGKELVADAIHERVGREENVRKINCAGLKEELLELELFGCVKGAFTGADEARYGVFSPKFRGTVLLDEIAELSMSCQAKILRVVDRKVAKRLGEADEFQVDVQLVVATLENLDELVKEKRFRADLLYRLRGAMITIPPLKERRADIMQLADLFLEKTRDKDHGPVGFSSEVIRAFLSYDWPGNVRELRQVVGVAARRYQAANSGKKHHYIISGEYIPQRVKDAILSPSLESCLAAPAPEIHLVERVERLEDWVDKILTGKEIGDSLGKTISEQPKTSYEAVRRLSMKNPDVLKMDIPKLAAELKKEFNITWGESQLYSVKKKLREEDSQA